MTIILFPSTPIPYQYAMTALISAVASGHQPIVVTLLERGAMVETADNVSYCDAMHGVWRVYGILHVMYRMIKYQ